MPMATEQEKELRRQLEEPLNCECRNYPLDSSAPLITMLDTPYYPPYGMDRLHYHNCMEIGVCLTGGGEVTLAGSVYRFSAGSVLVVPRGVYHNQQNVTGALQHWRYLVISDEYLARKTPERFRSEITALLDAIRDTGLFFESCAGTGIDAIVSLMYDLRRRDAADAGLELELCVYLLLMEIARRAGSAEISAAVESSFDASQRQPIEPALAYVYEHYKEDIHVSDLARSCSMSESYFRKVFSRIMNQSPLDYVNAYRIHRAMNLLRTSGDSVQSIAARAGFSSIAAFNRNFKQFSGTSPAAWRRSRMNK